MRRLITVLLVLVLMIGFTAPAAQAGHKTATNVALGLASFAVFSQLVGSFHYARPVYATPVYVAHPPAHVVYISQSHLVVVQPPLPPAPSVVYYPHGRHELRADGTRYYWVWIPNPPTPPSSGSQQPGITAQPPSVGPSAPAPSPGASCKPTGRYVKTPQGLLPECE